MSHAPPEVDPSIYKKKRITACARRCLCSVVRFQMKASAVHGVGELSEELSRMSDTMRAQLTRCAFDAPQFLKRAQTLVERRELSPDENVALRHARNAVAGKVEAVLPDHFARLPKRGSKEAREAEAIGLEAMKRGEFAFCVLAGGMATRMGGCIKALVEVVDRATFLALRLAENQMWATKVERPIPLWLMTNVLTDHDVVAALMAAKAPPHVRTFLQGLALRLTPEGRLFRDAMGEPSAYATGHGDVVDSLKRSGLLRDFLARGGKYVTITNLDNLGATIDPVILGSFIQSQAPLMFEVVDKDDGDRGGIPVLVDGHVQIVEEFRLPKSFDASRVRVFNTNTFHVRADALDTVKIDWKWCEVLKKVDGSSAIQFERLLQELTAVLDGVCVHVPRSGLETRFVPVKSVEQLENSRSAIAQMLRARSIID